jgi:hypothetical protein
VRFSKAAIQCLALRRGPAERGEVEAGDASRKRVADAALRLVALELVQLLRRCR